MHVSNNVPPEFPQHDRAPPRPLALARKLFPTPPARERAALFLHMTDMQGTACVDRSRQSLQSAVGMRISLPTGNYVLHFMLEDHLQLPVFAGHLWRGVLGLHLKRMSDGSASVPRNLPHGLQPQDLYTWFMETPPPPDASMMRRYPSVPHPYMLAAPVLDKPLRLQQGDMLQLPLILFGRANDLLNVVLLAFSRAARQGLGRQRAKAQLQKVMQVTGGEERLIFMPGRSFQAPEPRMLSIPDDAGPAPGQVEVRFHTPLRLAVQGRILPPSRFSPYPLVMNLLRRLSALDTFHGSGNPQVGAQRIKQAAERMRLLEAELHWRDLKRYSTRTRKEVPMGGVMGRCLLDISDAPEVWPILWAGQHVHAGKGAVFGLGSMIVRPLP